LLGFKASESAGFEDQRVVKFDVCSAHTNLYTRICRENVCGPNCTPSNAVVNGD
jgi:hypothetical protein